MENILGIVMMGIPLTGFIGVIFFAITEIRDSKNHKRGYL